ncbi:MAG: response regulator [Myxococcota bacterium]
MSSEDLRFLIVEDHRLSGRALKGFFSTYGDTALYRTLEDARAAESRIMSWDAVVVDVRLPDGSGVEFLKELRAAGCRAEALVLTGCRDFETIVEAQRQNSFFLPKPADKESLEAFVRWVKTAKRPQAKPLLTAVHRLSDKYGLSHQQAEVVWLASRNVSRDQIAEELGLKPSSLKTQVRRILKKSGHASLRALLQEVAYQTD